MILNDDIQKRGETFLIPTDNEQPKIPLDIFNDKNIELIRSSSIRDIISKNEFSSLLKFLICYIRQR